MTTGTRVQMYSIVKKNMGPINFLSINVCELKKKTKHS